MPHFFNIVDNNYTIRGIAADMSLLMPLYKDTQNQSLPATAENPLEYLCPVDWNFDILSLQPC